MNRYYEGAFGPVENVTAFFETTKVHDGNVVSADRVFMAAKQVERVMSHDVYRNVWCT